MLGTDLVFLKDYAFLLLVCAKSLLSYPILCDPMGFSLSGSSAHGIL